MPCEVVQSNLTLLIVDLIDGLKTKKDTVNAALKEFVERRRQKGIIGLFGSMLADDDYDYKSGRQ